MTPLSQVYADVTAAVRTDALNALAAFSDTSTLSRADAAVRAHVVQTVTPLVETWFSEGDAASSSNPFLLATRLGEAVTRAREQLIEALDLNPWLSGSLSYGKAPLHAAHAPDADCRLALGHALLHLLSGSGHRLYVASVRAENTFQVFQHSTALHAYNRVFDDLGHLEAGIARTPGRETPFHAC